MRNVTVTHCKFIYVLHGSSKPVLVAERFLMSTHVSRLAFFIPNIHCSSSVKDEASLCQCSNGYYDDYNVVLAMFQSEIPVCKFSSKRINLGWLPDGTIPIRILDVGYQASIYHINYIWNDYVPFIVINAFGGGDSDIRSLSSYTCH